jgi:hypothetical protein
MAVGGKQILTANRATGRHQSAYGRVYLPLTLPSFGSPVEEARQIISQLVVSKREK